jgi:hypothetical protein
MTIIALSNERPELAIISSFQIKDDHTLKWDAYLPKGNGTRNGYFCASQIPLNKGKVLQAFAVGLMHFTVPGNENVRMDDHVLSKHGIAEHFSAPSLRTS